MYFFDYGNAFLLEAVACRGRGDGRGGPLPLSLLCCSDIMGPDVLRLRLRALPLGLHLGKPEDLETTDSLAAEVLEEIRKHGSRRHPGAARRQHPLDPRGRAQPSGCRSQADPLCRLRGAHEDRLAFNRAVADGRLSAPVVLGRDHHDVSGTDSPYRETANIYDGSCLTADMAVQNVIGDAFRGATWVSLHNGGGVGWGEVINGGFGMVIDGSGGCRAADPRDAALGCQQRHRAPQLGA